MKNFLHYAQPSIDNEDKKNIERALFSGTLTAGDYLESFEDKLSKCCRSKYAIACSSGTMALHLLALALDVDKNTTVIVPSITFMASANAFKILGANIVLCDVDETSGLLSISALSRIISKVPKYNKIIVVVVHLGGRLVEIKKVKELVKNKGVIIEDACHAFGSYRIRNSLEKDFVGSCKYSIASTFSFHPTKTITSGEGGAITTNNKKLNEKIRILRNHGFIRKNNYYHQIFMSLNFRLSELNAALGYSQILKIEKIRLHRNILRKRYYKNLLGNELIKTYEGREKNLLDHLFQVKINFKKLKNRRKKIMFNLFQRKIGTQIHYKPLYNHKVYKNLSDKSNFNGTKTFYSSTLTLPLHNNLTINDVDYISQILIENIIKK